MMMRLKTAVCDDNKRDLSILKKELDNYNVETDIEFDCDYFSSPVKLLKSYEEGTAYDPGDTTMGEIGDNVLITVPIKLTAKQMVS